MTGIRLWSTCPDCRKDYPLDTGHPTTDCTAYDGDNIETCTFCGHDINHHGTTQVGCADCDCGYESDWHPDPPRGDE